MQEAKGRGRSVKGEQSQAVALEAWTLDRKGDERTEEESARLRSVLGDLVEICGGLIHRLVRRTLVGWGLDPKSADRNLYNDLYQSGVVGLLLTVKRWDPERAGFTTAAHFSIRDSIIRGFHRERVGMHVPAHAFNRKQRDEATAAAVGVALSVASLDVSPPTDDDGSSWESRFLADDAPSPDEEAEEGELVRCLYGLVEELPVREREVVLFRVLHTGDRLSLGDIATRWGVSRQRVEQLEKRAVRKLTTAMREAYA